ncbi:MAG: hypothetical protein ACRD1X_19575, partial [Vicinamibacteria bacterium]
MLVTFLFLLLIMMGPPQSAATPQDAEPSPTQKAVRFLAREVPRWRAEHDCYSCHNNGDAARALYLAVKENYS